MRKLISLLFFVIAFSSPVFFSSCSTDFDPNADFKEIIVIYGLLDPSETEHIVKVNKAFLNTKSNALAIAANVPDSVNFKNAITVQLQKLRTDSSVIETYPLQQFKVSAKNQGVFASPEQILYKTGRVVLDDKFIYRIVVTNPVTGTTARASTRLVKDFCVSQINVAPFQCSESSTPKRYEPEKFTIVKFVPALDAKIYKVGLNFKYKEINGTDTVSKETDMDVSSNFIKFYSASDLVRVESQPRTFLNHLNAAIDTRNDKPSTKRLAGELKFSITAGSEDLANYYIVNNSFSIVSQTRPEFTNVTNGTGLFASRRKKTVTSFLPDASIDSLRVIYPHLKF